MPSPANTTLSRLLRSHARSMPHRPAFTQLLDGEREERQLDWLSLDRRVDAAAEALRQRTQRGDRVLIVLPPDLDYIVAVLGCARAGIVAVPVYPPDAANPSRGVAQILGVIQDAGAVIGFTASQLRPLTELIDTAGAVIDWIEIEQAAETTPLDEENHADDLAILLYTSGSTGTPKGVMLSHRNLLQAACAMSEDAGLNTDTVFALWLPLYHVSGLFSTIVLPLWNGAQMVFFSPRLFVERPVRWLEAISRYRATLSGSPTFAYELIVRTTKAEDLSGLDLSCLQTMVVGGEAVLASTLDAFTELLAPLGLQREAIYTMFGLTEAAMISTGGGKLQGYKPHNINSEALASGRIVASNATSGTRLLVGSGHPLPGVSVAIVDTTRFERLGYDAIGEIWIAGDSVAQGYWNRPELTEATFRACLNDGEGPFLRTGDVGYWHDGQLHITGRLKEIIIIRGINHYPEDIETSIRQADPSLAQISCAAFAVEREDREELAVAVELPPLEKAEAQVLSERIRRCIAIDHGIQVSALAFCRPAELPRTNTGKLQRRRCAEQLEAGIWPLSADGQQAAVCVPALPEATAERLRHLVAHHLQIAPDDVPLNQPVAGLGFDSIQMVSLILDIRDIFGTTVQAARIYQASGLAELAAFLDGTAAPEADGVDANHDAVLDAVVCSDRLIAQSAEITAILLTGATGFLGGYLLQDLLRETQATLYCLVRAADAKTAGTRLAAALKAVGIEESVWTGRVQAVVGDLNAPKLGLAPTTWDMLSNHVDVIYHNGAAVDFIAPYSALRNINVGATLECLRLATSQRLKALHFTSTLAVFNGPDRIGMSQLGETDRFMLAEQVSGGYARSKWVSEALLSQAASRGVPVTVHRAGFVIGDSLTGRWNTEDFLCRLIKGSIQLGVYPDIDLDLVMAPADYISRAIVALSAQALPSGSVFHLIAPRPLALRQMMAWVAEAGWPLKSIPYGRWQSLLTDALPTDNALYPVLPFLTEALTNDGRTLIDLFIDPDRPVFTDTATRAQLSVSGPSCPPIEQALFVRALDWFTQIGFLPSDLRRKI